VRDLLCDRGGRAIRQRYYALWKPGSHTRPPDDIIVANDAIAKRHYRARYLIVCIDIEHNNLWRCERPPEWCASQILGNCPIPPHTGLRELEDGELGQVFIADVNVRVNGDPSYRRRSALPVGHRLNGVPGYIDWMAQYSGL